MGDPFAFIALGLAVAVHMAGLRIFLGRHQPRSLHHPFDASAPKSRPANRNEPRHEARTAAGR